MSSITINYSGSPKLLKENFNGEFIYKPTNQGSVTFDSDRFVLINTPTSKVSAENPSPFVSSAQMIHALESQLSNPEMSGADGYMLSAFLHNPELIPNFFFGETDESYALIFFPGANTIRQYQYRERIAGHYQKINAGRKDERSEWVPEQEVLRTSITKTAYALVKRRSGYVWQQFVFEKDSQGFGGFGAECKWLFLRN